MHEIKKVTPPPAMDPADDETGDLPEPGEPWNEHLVKALNARYIQAQRRVSHAEEGSSVDCVHNMSHDEPDICMAQLSTVVQTVE